MNKLIWRVTRLKIEDVLKSGLVCSSNLENLVINLNILN